MISSNNVRINLGHGFTLSLTQNYNDDGDDLTNSSRDGGTVEAGLFRGDKMVDITETRDVAGWLNWDQLVDLVERVQDEIRRMVIPQVGDVVEYCGSHPNYYGIYTVTDKFYPGMLGKRRDGISYNLVGDTEDSYLLNVSIRSLKLKG